jgi:Lysozyme like domain
MGVLTMRLSPHEIAHIAKTVPWTTGEQRIAIAIALAESSGETDALARSETGASIGNRDHGLWQISGRWHGDKLQRRPNWRNPYENVKIAYEIFVGVGRVWTPWSVFTSNAYAKYLPDAEIAMRFPFPIVYPSFQFETIP